MAFEDRKYENEKIERYFQDFSDSNSEEFYGSGICDLPRRWSKAIDTNGEYICSINNF